jgi:hypothetical protein
LPIRRLNFTGRKRIRQADARITIRPDAQGFRFDAELRLDGYDLPRNALVFVEAYRQTSWMRYRFGTVSEISPLDEPRLTEFGSCEGVLFRVRVTSASSLRGLLLAEADKIRPRRTDREDDQHLPLLPARPDESLGAEIFRLDFDDSPLLLINLGVGDWQSLTQDPTFQALVLPAVLREILTRILYIEGYFELDDDDWRSQWLRFASGLPGVTEPPKEHESDRFDDWIDDAVSSFALRVDSIERFRHYWTGETEA